MADSKSLGWEIEKIVDCNGDDMTDTDNGWVRIHPMSGKGNTKAQVSVDPSSYWYDCKEAVVTISAETGDKKYITINRCNPECNCDAIKKFTPLDNIGVFPSTGGEQIIATYEMKYCCDGENSIGLVNTDAYCDYYLEEIIDDDDPCSITGNVWANVKENTNTDSERFFSYYVTYNGVRCNQIPLEGNAFKQERAKHECELVETCPDISYTGNTSIPYNQSTIYVNLKDFTYCWNLEIIEGGSGKYFEIKSSGDEFVELYIGENTRYSQPNGFLFEFNFGNIYDIEKGCIRYLAITQQGKPPVPTCENCNDYMIGQFKAVTGSFDAGSQSNKTIASFTANCRPDSDFKIDHTGNNIIFDKNSVVLYPQPDNKTYIVTANINENLSTDGREDYFNIFVDNNLPCTDSVKITQKGKDTSKKYCEIKRRGLNIGCIGNEQTLILEIYKADSSCSYETWADWEVWTAHKDLSNKWQKDALKVNGSIQITATNPDDSTKINISSSNIEVGDYIIVVRNWQESSNSFEQHVFVSRECGTVDTVKIRFQISTQSSDTYLLTIDNFMCYLKNRENGDKICFPLTTSNWKGEYLDLNDMTNKVGDVDEGQFVPLSPVVKTDCDFCEYMYTMELGSQPNTSKLYTKIYQDVIISKAEYNIIEGEIEHYDLYVVEKYATRGGSPTSSSDIKLRNSASPTAIPVKWGLYDGSNLYINGSYLLTGHLDEYICENEDSDYRTRINFIYSGSSSCSHNSGEYCLTVEDFEQYDYGEYNSLFEVRLWPKEQSRAREGELDDDNVGETNNDVEVTDGNNK